MHAYQRTCMAGCMSYFKACVAACVAEKLADHNHFLALNSVSYAALLGWEAQAECILSSISHTLHAPAPGGWAEHQLQGSESILICQYERLDYHWGRLRGPHVREVYNGRGSRKEGERNERGRRTAGWEIENFQCFCMVNLVACLASEAPWNWFESRGKSYSRGQNYRRGDGGIRGGSQGHWKGGCHSMSPSAGCVCVCMCVCVYILCTYCICVCCDERLHGEGWGGRNIMLASRL